MDRVTFLHHLTTGPGWVFRMIHLEHRVMEIVIELLPQSLELPDLTVFEGLVQDSMDELETFEQSFEILHTILSCDSVRGIPALIIEALDTLHGEFQIVRDLQKVLPELRHTELRRILLFDLGTSSDVLCLRQLTHETILEFRDLGILELQRFLMLRESDHTAFRASVSVVLGFLGCSLRLAVPIRGLSFCLLLLILLSSGREPTTGCWTIAAAAAADDGGEELTALECRPAIPADTAPRMPGAAPGEMGWMGGEQSTGGRCVEESCRLPHTSALFNQT